MNKWTILWPEYRENINNDYLSYLPHLLYFYRDLSKFQLIKKYIFCQLTIFILRILLLLRRVIDRRRSRILKKFNQITQHNYICEINTRELNRYSHADCLNWNILFKTKALLELTMQFNGSEILWDCKANINNGWIVRNYGKNLKNIVYIFFRNWTISKVFN